MGWGVRGSGWGCAGCLCGGLQAYAELIRGDMGLKQLTLSDIVAEMKAPFADPRKLDRTDVRDMKLRSWELTPREQFNLLTMSQDRLVRLVPQRRRGSGTCPEPVPACVCVCVWLGDRGIGSTYTSPDPRSGDREPLVSRRRRHPCDPRFVPSGQARRDRGLGRGGWDLGCVLGSRCRARIGLCRARVLSVWGVQVLGADADGRRGDEAGLVSTLINTVVFVRVVHLHRQKPRDHDGNAAAVQEAPYKVRLARGVPRAELG